MITLATPEHMQKYFNMQLGPDKTSLVLPAKGALAPFIARYKYFATKGKGTTGMGDIGEEAEGPDGGHVQVRILRDYRCSRIGY